MSDGDSWRTIHNGLTHTRAPMLAFVDADNVKHSLERSLRVRGIDESQIDEFSLLDVLEVFRAFCERFYIYSSVKAGADPPDYISRIRARPRTVFRETPLVEVQGRRKQEGVDVYLAVEAMQCASKKTMNSCAIFTSDGDLLPLIHALVSEGVTTHVVSFNNPDKSSVAKRVRDAADNSYFLSSSFLSVAFGNMLQTGRNNAQPLHQILTFGQKQIVENEFGKFLTVQTKEGTCIVVSPEAERSGDYRWTECRTPIHADLFLRVNMGYPRAGFG